MPEPSSSRRILYPGSFDPCTRGHLDLIARAARVFDEVVVAVGTNVAKEGGLFSTEERVALLEESLAGSPGVRVVAFGGLAVACAREQGCGTILRGVRNGSDLELELQMGLTNRVLAPDVETLVMFPDPRWIFLSSRLIKEVYRMGGEVADFLPPAVAARVGARLRKPC